MKRIFRNPSTAICNIAANDMNDLDFNFLRDQAEQGTEYAESRYQEAKQLRREMERPEGWRARLENPRL